MLLSPPYSTVGRDHVHPVLWGPTAPQREQQAHRAGAGAQSLERDCSRAMAGSGTLCPGRALPSERAVKQFFDFW